MRHLHFTQSLEPLQGGGLGSSALALHRQLRASGIDSMLCSTHGGRAQQVAESTFEYHRLKPDFAYFSPALLREGPRLVRQSDVLHGHGLYVGTNFVFGREARKLVKPLVYHVQGMFEPYILRRSRWKKRIVHWLFEDANIRHVRLWRALTGKEAGQIRALGYKAPIVVVPNGLNVAEYSRPPETDAPIETRLAGGLPKSKRRLLFMGRIHPKKGLDLLLPAWARVVRQHSDWELVVAGPDENGYLRTIQELARALGLEDKIIFTGAVTGTTKLALLHSADVFVLPSYSEGMPMAVLEAMACHVPVIVTPGCNLPEIVPGEAGWECEPTADSVAAVLCRAIDTEPAERLQIGENGRRLVERRYSWPVIVSELVKACEAYCA